MFQNILVQISANWVFQLFFIELLAENAIEKKL